MTTELIHTQCQAGIATITINRPEKYNALTHAMLGELRQTLADLEVNSACRVIILRSNGGVFCAGHDLTEMHANANPEFQLNLFQDCCALMLAMLRQPQPVIAAVDGAATAAGCQLVATADLAIATPSSQFAVSGINLGLFCGTPSVALSRNVTRKKAFEMLFSGDFISAEKALQDGLLNRVCEDLEAGLQEFTSRIIAKPPRVVAIGKKLFYQQLERDIDSAYTLATKSMTCNLQLPETQEGISAFLEKRANRWDSISS